MICSLNGFWSHTSGELLTSFDASNFMDDNVIINDIKLHDVKINSENPKIINGNYFELEAVLHPEIKNEPDFTFNKKYLDDYKKKFPKLYPERFPENHIKVFKLSGLDENNVSHSYEIFFMNEGYDDWLGEESCWLEKIEEK
jgi:hypothetical protein